MKNDKMYQRFEMLMQKYQSVDHSIKKAEELKDKLKPEIKKCLEELDLQKYESTFGTASFSMRDQSTINEQQLIRDLEVLGMSDQVMKTKEYLDHDAVEKLVVEGIIPTKIIEQNTKVVTKKVLTIRAAKK